LRARPVAAEGGVDGGPDAWGRLWRFPGFWWGLALVVYVAIQTLNPNHVCVRDGDGWIVTPRANIGWLPTSVAGLPETGNTAWRALLVYASAWLTVCGIWVGLTRRAAVERLFVVVAVNGAVLALAGAAARLAGNGKLLWVITPDRFSSGFASFNYKNSAGAYLALTAAVCLALAVRYRDRAIRRFDKSSPAPVFVILGLFTAIVVVVSRCRAATVLIGCFLPLAGAVALFLRPRDDGGGRPIIGAILGVLFAGFAVFALQAFGLEKILRGFGEFVESGVEAGSVSFRAAIRSATLEMLRDHGLRGIGPDSFGYLMPGYAAEQPALGDAQVWFAHCDWLNVPLELGLGGVLLLLGGAGSVGVVLVRTAVWRNSWGVLVLLGCGMTLAHAWVDGVLRNAAVMITWTALVVALARWQMFEQPPGRR
jgi:O-Antigen ligase